jgi:hypothetical protein
MVHCGEVRQESLSFLLVRFWSLASLLRGLRFVMGYATATGSTVRGSVDLPKTLI